LSSIEVYDGFRLEDVDAVKRKNLKKMLLFSVCLSSNIGGKRGGLWTYLNFLNADHDFNSCSFAHLGTGVITGTASNLVFQELIKP
jgi:hypothetical protein